MNIFLIIVLSVFIGYTLEAILTALTAITIILILKIFQGEKKDE